MSKNSKLNIIYVFLGIVYVWVLLYINNILETFTNFQIIFLMGLYLIFGYGVYNNQKWTIFFVYIIFVIMVLFFRNSKTGINFDLYLSDWIKYIFKNKIVFINIIGNILLFIPLGIFLNKEILFLIGILIIIGMEFFQFLFDVGIFDVVDILLNIIGFVIGFIGVNIWKKIRRIK